MSILIVDDSEFIHQQLKIFLAHGGHTDLVFASSGAEAFDILGLDKPDQLKQKIDLVLMDVLMPGMTGIEATSKIKANPDFNELPVIIITTETSPETLRSAFEAGASDHILKPLKEVELLARVDAALRLKEETDRRMKQELELRSLNQDLQAAFERITGEMDLVARLQGFLLPRRSPRLPGVEVETLYRPSGQASGDYYDYFEVEKNILRLVVADVSGHGARAAFIMAIVRTLFHAGATVGMNLEETLGLVNTHLCETLGQESDFATIFAADLDLAQGELRYVSAGHCPCLLLNGKGPTQTLPAMTPPAGFVPTHYQARTVSLADQGRLFLFTDGLYEWQVAPGQIFGLEPFLLLIEDQLPRPEYFLAQIEEQLLTVTGRKPDFNDDLTALLVSWDKNIFHDKQSC